MDARTVDHAASRLRELRLTEWQDLGLGALALGASLVMTEAHPPLALPLFVGGLFVGALGMRALVLRFDLLERLAGERDAHLIAEVRLHAARQATMDRRRLLAAYVRSWLREPLAPRVRDAAEDLEALAAELDDDALALDPVCAVACARLMSDPALSPLLNGALTEGELRSRVRQIRSGFASRSPSA